MFRLSVVVIVTTVFMFARDAHGDGPFTVIPLSVEGYPELSLLNFVVADDGKTFLATRIYADGFRHDSLIWTESNGLHNVLALPGWVNPNGRPTIISGDGKVIGVGRNLWSASSGLLPLPIEPKKLSYDGSVVIGVTVNPGGAQTYWRWTAEAGAIPIKTDTQDEGVGYFSLDGRVGAGVWREPSQNGRQLLPIIWTPETGIRFLDLLPGTNAGGITSLSEDGSTLIGVVYDYKTSTPAHFVRWKQGEGVVELTPDEYSRGVYLSPTGAASGDGTRAIVATPGGPGAGDDTYYVWDAQLGVHALSDLGIDLQGWDLSGDGVISISNNGRFVVGSAHNPQTNIYGAYILDLAQAVPEPATLALAAVGALAVAIVARRRAMRRIVGKQMLVRSYSSDSCPDAAPS